MVLDKGGTDRVKSPKSAQKCASHSCSRCRRLKKKCSRDLPSCLNCLKAGQPCDYPGRAPRRKRKEIEEAIRRGEHQTRECKKSKTEKERHDMVSATSVTSFLNLLNTLNHSNGTANNESNIRDEDRKAEPARIRHHSETAQLDNARSRSGSGSDLRTTLSNEANGTSSNGADSSLSSAESHTSLMSSPEETAQPENSKVRQKDAFDIHADIAEHEKRTNNESTPITASAIQIEAVLSVFKGGRTTPMKLPLNIERPLYDRFVAAFFKHNHKAYPLLNKVEFLNRVSGIRDFDSLPKCTDDVFVFQLYMIMAIGCTTLHRAGMLSCDEERLSEHFAYMSMKRFCPVMHLQNLETIKCLLLLGIYSFFEPKGVSSWTISGLVMRLCIGFGLNRALTAKKLKSMSVIDVEMRYRSFWAFYSYERLVATSLGRISCLSDDDISAPLPRPLFEEEKDDIEVTNMMIGLRRIGGRIYRKVHSVGAGKKKLTAEEKQALIDRLRQELDETYNMEASKIHVAKKETTNISFHHSDLWLSMRYYQLQIMLYRPSALIPKPAIDSLTILGDACLKSLKYTYNLYQKKLLPLNWITLFRVLTICNTMLYCLCHWSIDIIESKIEIHQCIEVLRHFGAKWVFAAKCADVFSNIINTILDISLSNGRVPNMDKLTKELFGASNEYHDILDENNVDISWVDSIV